MLRKFSGKYSSQILNAIKVKLRESFTYGKGEICEVGVGGIGGEEVGECVESNGLGRASDKLSDQLDRCRGVSGVDGDGGEEANALFGKRTLD